MTSLLSHNAKQASSNRANTFAKVAEAIDNAIGLQQVDVAKLRSPFFSNDNSRRSPFPSIDRRTMSSDSDITDSDTLSDEDEDSQATFGSSNSSLQSRPRSIFNNYWQKKGGASCVRRALTSSPMVTVDSLKRSPNAYEFSLHQNEDAYRNRQATNAKESRRNIFHKGCLSASEPALSLISLQKDNYVRRTRSTAVLKQPKTSCLRRSKFSGKVQSSGNELTDFSETSSVSFHAKVDVVIYETPKEVYSQKGWSSYFA